MRLTAVDALRGLVMVIMALDHTRDFFHVGAMSFSPEDLAKSTPLLFFTRWITHICAPTFMFLAGVGAGLRLERDGDRAGLSRFLWTRGLWLVILELTVMRLAMNFSLGVQNPVLVIVLSAIGLSMIVLAALIHLPRSWLLVASVLVIALHNTLDGIRAAQLGAFAGVWHLLHQQGVVFIAGVPFVIGYPLVPWFAVMAAGFVIGPWLFARPKWPRTALVMGAAMLVGFVILRAANVYGDPSPWSMQRSPIVTLLSFLRTTKYPPSLQFLLMTLGPALMLLALLDRFQARWRDALIAIGRVPLFFYVVHFWTLHVLVSIMAWVRYGQASLGFLLHPLPSMGGPRELFPPDVGYPLWVTYIVWIAICLSLYPLCRWFASVKRRHRAWWLSYM